MTKTKVIKAIALTVPGDRTQALEIAEAYLEGAVLKMGRMTDADWNRKSVAFTLTSGTSSYKVGSEILTDYKDLKGLSGLEFTDTKTHSCALIDVERFGVYARGSTNSGRPQIATLHSSDDILEFWPIPDSNYAMWAQVRFKVASFDDVPEEYHDVVISTANAAVKAAGDAMAALRLDAENRKEIQEESLTSWTGSTIGISRHLGGSKSAGRADSGNLRGE